MSFPWEHSYCVGDDLGAVILSGLLIAGIGFNVDFGKHYVNTIVN